MSDRLFCTLCQESYPPSVVRDGVCVACRSDRGAEPTKTLPPSQKSDSASLHSAVARRLKNLDGQLNPGPEVTRPAIDLSLSIRKERARRELCRRHLLPFVERFNPNYEAGWVHKDICERLEQFSRDISDKKSPRLMVFMPPRHGKSELASRMFPAWHLGHNPTHEVIAASYASSLALKFSRKVRSVVGDLPYRQIFPGVSVDKDNKSAESWLTNKGGGYMAAGVSGPLTGNGMDLGIIDDPVKNREEAESDTVRNSIKEWYTSTFYTRLAPGAGILIILTRWHDDDLAGWLLEQEKLGGDKWEVVRYEAEAEEDQTYRNKGEALHPDRYDIKALTQIKNAIGPRDWQALFQQNPTAVDGDYFKTGMVRYYHADQRPPLDELKTYTAWDLAIGTKEHNDYSVGITVGVDGKENIWILDVVRARMAALEITEAIIDMHVRWGTQVTGIEKGHIEMTLGPFLRRRIRERRCYSLTFEGLKPGRRDKQARAKSIQGRMEQGMVMFPKEAPWTQELVNELLRFPNGKHDDQVDALAWIGQLIDMFIIYVKPAPKKKASWRDRLTASVRRGSSSSSMAS